MISIYFVPADTKTDRTLNTLRASWEASYGRMFSAGLLAHGMVPDLIRGLAFLQLAAQDDSTDTLAVLKRIETAVATLCTELKV